LEVINENIYINTNGYLLSDNDGYGLSCGGRVVMYRLLKNGEVIKKGDEILLDDCETWESVPLGEGKTVGETWIIGAEYNKMFFVPMRRNED
jgi:hypothetical protein